MKSKTKLSIQSWHESDRPREKFLEFGRQSVSDSELLAILIATGSKNESALDLSKKILASVGNDLNELGKLSIYDLTRFNGIGKVKALTLISAMELGRRRKIQRPSEKNKISCSQDVFEVIFGEMEDLNYESFWVLFLDRNNQLIKKIEHSRGGVSATVVDARMIFKAAIEHLASGIILCHNHPSGNLNPSEQDKSITSRLKEAGKLIEVNVLDHLIIAGKDFYSFADNGIL